jgi:hypothetical protein
VARKSPFATFAASADSLAFTTSACAASSSAWRSATQRISSTPRRQDATRKTSSKITQPACSNHRHPLVDSTPYTDCGHSEPRRK